MDYRIAVLLSCYLCIAVFIVLSVILYITNNLIKQDPKYKKSRGKIERLEAIAAYYNMLIRNSHRYHDQVLQNEANGMIAAALLKLLPENVKTLYVNPSIRVTRESGNDLWHLSDVKAYCDKLSREIWRR